MTQPIGSQAGNRRVTKPGLEFVHPGEEITNPALGQVPTGTRDGRGTIQIGKIENNFHLQEFDPMILERQLNSFFTRKRNFR